MSCDKGHIFLGEGGSMLGVKIRLMGPMADFIGKTELDVQVKEGTTLCDVFQEVGREYGQNVKKKIIAPDGDFHPYVLVSLNGTDVRGQKGIDTRLNDGDEVLLALLITGG
jgi:MoaD family protein